MSKIQITRDDIKEFRNSDNGKIKILWMRIGVIIDLLATLVISLLNIYANYLKSPWYYYLILYLLLVIVVVGGEFIGTYFGALEQYVICKYTKKKIDYIDS